MQKNQKKKEENWNVIATGISKIVKVFEDKELYGLVAEYYFRGKIWDEAAEFWENAEQINHNKYFWAKGLDEISSTPQERISWLVKLPPTEGDKVKPHVQKIWTANTEKDPESAKAIAWFFWEAKDYREAVKFWKIAKYTVHEKYFWSKYKISDDLKERLNCLQCLQKLRTTRKLDAEIRKVWNDIKQSESAIRSISGDLKRWLIRFFKRNRSDSEVYKLTQFCQELLDWVELIDRGRQDELVQWIALSPLNKEDFKKEWRNLNPNERGSLKKIIELESSFLRNKETVREELKRHECFYLCWLGSAIEKVDDNPYLIGLLTLYEEIWQNRENAPSTIRWAKERWIAVKQKKIDDLENKIKKSKESAEKSRSDEDYSGAKRMEKEARKWTDTRKQDIADKKRKMEEWQISEEPDSFPGPIPVEETPPIVEREPDNLHSPITTTLPTSEALGETEEPKLQQVLDALITQFNQRYPEEAMVIGLINALINSDEACKMLWNESVREHIEKFAQDEKIKELMDEIDDRINPFPEDDDEYLSQTFDALEKLMETHPYLVAEPDPDLIELADELTQGVEIE